MSRMRLRHSDIFLLTVLVFSGLCAASSQAYAAACPATGDVGPCYVQLDAYVRKDFAGGNSSNLTPITPRAVATDLNVPEPSFKPNAADYQVLYNFSAPNERLLVFAPGQPNLPQSYEWFAVRAAQRGYNVIVLHYWNDKEDAKPGLCNSTFSTPAERDACLTGLFEAWFRNKDALTSAHSNTPTGQLLVDQDQFRNRLRKLLIYLSDHFPGQDWKKFAADHNGGFDTPPYIDWGKVTLAGHSSGSKLVTHMAQQVLVRRLLILSGPNIFYDVSPGVTACPSSIAPIGQTPATSIYVYYNTNDPKAAYAEACHSAMGLNVLGRYAITDAYATYGAHVIFNSAFAHSSCDDGVAGPDSSHISTASDCALSPAPDGTLLPSLSMTYGVWDYLLTR